MKKFLILLLVLSAAGCGGRMPNTQTTTRLIRNHFNDYADKYKTSVFGKKKVASVELLKVEEIHKNLVSVAAFVTMSAPKGASESPDVHKVRVTLEKGPFGWRYLAWENLGGGSQLVPGSN